jgi:hypothetical protein
MEVEMTYTILKTENGDSRVLHRFIESREAARELLDCIAQNYKLQKRKVKKLSCAVIVDGKVTYQIGE